MRVNFLWNVLEIIDDDDDFDDDDDGGNHDDHDDDDDYDDCDDDNNDDDNDEDDDDDNVPVVPVDHTLHLSSKKYQCKTRCHQGHNIAPNNLNHGESTCYTSDLLVHNLVILILYELLAFVILGKYRRDITSQHKVCHGSQVAYILQM